MRFLGITGLALAAGFGLSAAAAYADQKPAPATTHRAAAAEDQAVAELNAHHRHHHHGGIVRFIALSLDTLGVEDAKRAQVDKLHSDLHAQMTPARDAEKNVLVTLADGIAAGAVDKVKVDSAIAALTTVADAQREASLNTINELHAVLSPAERAALVEKVQAHWAVWRQVNHEEAAGRRERDGRLADLTKELSLTPHEVNKISAALPAAPAGPRGEFDPKKVEAHVQAFATAFESGSFDAKSVISNADADLASHGATRMAHFYETVTPLLTPEQRTKLAEHLRGHASYQSVASGK
jgi:Spy/CpxP family protein refolding chaperone